MPVPPPMLKFFQKTAYKDGIALYISQSGTVACTGYALGMLDFSVIQLEALNLLENNQNTVLVPLREKLRYLMVDEYQDTNTVQERILFALLNESQNICVVGDDDQGLYRFRGATIRNILEFPARFAPGQCAIHSLTVNYRSDPGIIDFYNQWMDGSLDGFSWGGGAGTTFRYPKAIVPPAGKKSFEHPVVRVSGAAGAQGWHVKNGTMPVEGAFLYRKLVNELSYKDGSDIIESSLGTTYDLSIFRAV